MFQSDSKHSFYRLLGGVTLFEALFLWVVFSFAYPIQTKVLLFFTLLFSTLLVCLTTYLIIRGPLNRFFYTNDEETARKASRELSRLPFWFFLLRPLVWTLSTLPGILFMVFTEVLSTDAAWLLPNLTAGATVLSGGVLALLFRRILRRVIHKDDAIWYYATTLHEFMFFVSISMAAVGVLTARLMYHAILGITVVHFRKNAELSTLFGLLAGFLWIGIISYWTRKPRAFLLKIAKLQEEEEQEKILAPVKQESSFFFAPRAKRKSLLSTSKLLPEAIRTYRNLQALPSRVAIGSFTIWFLANGATAFLQNYWFGSSPEDMFLMIVLGTILASCLTLYALAWHRAGVRVGLCYLSTRFRIQLDNVRGQFSIRTRVAFTFGLLLICACFAALLTTISQFRRASTALVAKQARNHAEELVKTIQQNSKEGDIERQSIKEIETLSLEAKELAVYFPKEGPPTIAGNLPNPKRLKEYIAAAPEGSSLELTGLGLAGGYARIEPYGTIVFLSPVEGVPGLERPLVILLGFFVLLTSGCLGIVVAAAKDLTSPLEDLAGYASVIAAGDLRRRIPLGETDEIGYLTQAFEKMRESLAEKVHDIQILNDDLRDVNAGLEGKVQARTAELENKHKQLKEAQTQLVQTEKMASLGFLVAGIAHDLNNPINFIQNNLPPLSEILSELLEVVHAYQNAALAFEKDDKEAESLLSDAEKKAKALDIKETEHDLSELLRMLRNGADRTAHIVASLKTFSRVGEAKQKDTNLHQGLDETLELLGYHFRQKQITIKKEYGDLGLVRCDAGAMNQVFMNLLTNAFDAISESEQDAPSITLRTYQEDTCVVIEIEDNGSGIPKESLSRIFEPFFTTKDTGKGTGLGLSISHRILVEHGGTLTVRSEAGVFTCFTVKIPRQGKVSSMTKIPENSQNPLQDTLS